MVNNPSHSVTLLRRLGAIFYDTLLIGSCVLIAGGILNTLITQLLGLPEIIPGSGLARLLFILEILMVFGLVGWFWTHGGQTLGMRAWKLRVVSAHGQTLTWQQAAVRFIMSLGSFLALGAGFLMALFDPDKLTWHDRYSRTYLIRTDG